MIKKIFATALSLVIICEMLLLAPAVTLAVSTNSQAAPWTLEKAEHLARKSYFAATPERIQALYAAGSASAAVNLVFPDAVGPDRTSYNNEISGLTGSGFNWADGGHAARLYQYRYARDPYEPKAKLFSVFEDIFSVNNSDKISYRDIVDQHDLIYSHTLGNFRTMIKRNLYTAGGTGDYASGKFLDLLDQTDPKDPNENYGRELLQLFMMGEYKPGESKELGSTRNYEERDVASIARILTGYESDSLTHRVNYNPSKHNTSTWVLFLSGSLANGMSFPFVNSSWALDLAAMVAPIGGNNGLGDNTIDYIFAMREEAISLFLADRLYRLYVEDKPSRANIDTFAAQIRNNNFELLPSVKWLLSSDMMFSDKSMNALAYKNPLELTIGTIKLLHKDSPNTLDPMLLDTNLLGRINWSPFFPGSVFGRDGFDDNAKFYSSYTQNQWISYTSRVAFDTASGSYLLSELIPATSVEISSPIVISSSTGNTYTGSLVISTAQLNLSAASGATVGSGSILTLTGGVISLPALSLTTATGTLTMSDAIYDPAALTITVRVGTLTRGTIITPVTSWVITLTPTSRLRSEITPSQLFESLENRLLLGRRLPTSVKSAMADFLLTNTDGTPTLFRPSLASYANSKIRSVIAMFLAQPEFVLQTGVDKPIVNENLAQSALANATGKLLFVELGGGYDWLHGVIPKAEYQDYINKRTNTGGTIVIDQSHVTDIGDFYMNSAIATGSGWAPSLKSLYDSNNLRIFNRVGTKQHSRDHDQAQKQMASYLSTTDDEADGVFGQLVRYEPSSESTISLTGKRPNVFRGGRYINIGPSGAVFSNWYLGDTDRAAHFTALRSMMRARAYPDRSADLFKAAIRVDEIASISKSTGGPDGAGWGNVNNLKFLRTLMTNNTGKAFFMQADGGYDTHSKQLAPQSNFDAMNIPKDLNYNIGRVMSNLTAFFNDMKATQDLTIVVFSEFGRTIEVNGDLGTDHGEGGGMFVLSNNQAFLSSVTSKVSGNISLRNAQENWLGVGIDYRSVYGKIYKALYGVSDISHFGSVNNLATDVSITPARTALTRTEYRANNDWGARINHKFRVEGENFDSDMAAYVRATRPKDPNSATYVAEQINNWEMQNYAKKPDNVYEINRDWVQADRPYPLSYTAFTDQYVATDKSVNLRSPRIVPGGQAAIVSGTGTQIFRRYENTVATPAGVALTGSGIILGNTVGTGAVAPLLRSADGIEILMSTGSTTVNTITSSSGSKNWYGGFVVGELVDPTSFISERARMWASGSLLLGQNIERVARVGADTLGIGMQISRPVQITIPAPVNSEYRVITSEDGLNWSPQGSGAVLNSGAGGRVSFMTDHFSYFALVSSAAVVPPSCTITASNTNPFNGTPVTLTWSSTNTLSASLSGVGTQVIAGSTSVTPAIDTGTAYTLTITGAGGLSSSCQVVVTTVGMPAPSTGGSGTGGGGGWSSSGGGGGGWSAVSTGAPVVGGSGIPAGNPFTEDVCPNGDKSPSRFDSKCDAMVTQVSVVTTNPAPTTALAPVATVTTVVTPIKPGKVARPPRTPKPPRAPRPPRVTPVKTSSVPKVPTRVTFEPVSQDQVTDLSTLTISTNPVFDGYDWNIDRRLPPEIYSIIDAKITSYEQRLLLDRKTLWGKLENMLALIRARLRENSLTPRERRILLYLETEFTILAKLYSGPRIL